LLLITNSEWHYTRAMMEYTFDGFLPNGTWRDLFDVVIVSARKPGFFSRQSPLFEVVDEDGLLKPATRMHGANRIYYGGNATTVEDHLGCSGDEILYVGDHIFADVKVSKSVRRWRTALVLREMENEIHAMTDFTPSQTAMSDHMARKERLELEHSQTRLMLQRARTGYGPRPKQSVKSLERRLARLREKIDAIDRDVSPLAVAAGELNNVQWGPIMRAGNDKSHMARQIESHADIYMSRVSNFLHHTPFFYFRSPRGSLPHDP
jgi:hypothetical protein